MNIPNIKDEVYQLRIYKEKKSWTDAQLATSMTSFGGSWTEGFLSNLFKGKITPSEYHRQFIRQYLLNQYMNESLST